MYRSISINYSSPNTPNLRDLQNVDKLKSILIPILIENKSRSNKPILLKISPDLNDSDIKSIVKLSMNLKLNGHGKEILSELKNNLTYQKTIIREANQNIFEKDLSLSLINN